MAFAKHPNWEKPASEVVDINELDQSILRPKHNQTFRDWFDQIMGEVEKPTIICGLISSASNPRISHNTLCGRYQSLRRRGLIRTKYIVQAMKPARETVVPGDKDNWFSAAVDSIRAGLQPGEQAEMIVTITAIVKNSVPVPQDNTEDRS